MALVGAGLSVTVQEPEAPEPRLPGVQASPVMAGAAGTEPVTEPPVTVKAVKVPAGSAANAFVILIGAEAVPTESVTLTVATTPFAMAVAFAPDKMHVELPEREVHDKVLPARSALVPAASVTDTRLVGE